MARILSNPVNYNPCHMTTYMISIPIYSLNLIAFTCTQVAHSLQKSILNHNLQRLIPAIGSDVAFKALKPSLNIVISASTLFFLINEFSIA